MMQNNPDFISREELDKLTEARLTGTMIKDADLAKKVATSGMIIKSRRVEMGMTQKQLAALAGVHESAIAQYEKGMRNPTFETINRLCDALGLTADYLMGRKPKSFEDLLQNDHTAFVLRKIIHFTQLQRDNIISFIKFIDQQNNEKIAASENN